MDVPSTHVGQQTISYRSKTKVPRCFQFEMCLGVCFAQASSYRGPARGGTTIECLRVDKPLLLLQEHSQVSCTLASSNSNQVLLVLGRNTHANREQSTTPTESNHDQLVVRVCWVSVGRLLSTFPPFLRTCKSSWNLLTPSPLLNISNQSTSHLTEQPAHQPTIQTKTGMSTQQPTGILLRLFAAPKTSGANSRPGYKSRHSTLPTKQVMHRPLLEDIFHL